MAIKKEHREKTYNKYGKKCSYCGCELPTIKDMEVDHIHPKALGGKDELINYNPSCKQCNFYKGTFTIEGFREQINTLNERLMKPFINRLAIKHKILIYKPFDGKFYFERLK